MNTKVMLCVLLLAALFFGCSTPTPEPEKDFLVGFTVEGIYNNRALCTLKIINNTSMAFHISSMQVRLCSVDDFCFSDYLDGTTISPHYQDVSQRYVDYHPTFSYIEVITEGLWEDGSWGSFTHRSYF